MGWLRYSLSFVFVILAISGPWLAPYAPDALDLWHAFELPNRLHWLGTADNGVDILSSILYGARIAGIVSFATVAVSLVVGTLLGTLAGLRAGLVEQAVLSFADWVQTFPGIILNIALLALIAKPTLMHMIGALMVNGWVIYARIARAQTLSLKSRDFVMAARAIGVSTPRLLLRHIVPNIAGPLIIQATSGLGAMVLAESTLSFLGLGPTGSGAAAISWGALLDQGTSVLLRFPHVALYSGAMIALTVFGFNLSGDALRERLDPQSEGAD